MGNNKFRLSNMIPNAWFYKLKDMGKASRRSTATQNWQKRSQTQRTNITPSSHSPQPQQANLSNRTSYYFPSRERTEKLSCSPIHPKASDTHFPVDPPRKSNGRIKPRPARPTIKLVSPDSSMCEGSFYHCKDYRDDLRSLPITDSGGFCRVVSSSIDNIIDMDKDSSFDKYFDGVLELDLPPIITKPVKKVVSGAYSDGIAEGSEQRRNPERKTQSGIHRIKIKESSPRLPKRRTQACHRSRKSFRSKAVMRQGNMLSESFAVMKSSSDPQRDFKESMVEMIIENNIRASEDMEELLACYLSLNSDEYRKIIVDVFMAIWLDITNMKL